MTKYTLTALSFVLARRATGARPGDEADACASAARARDPIKRDRLQRACAALRTEQSESTRPARRAARQADVGALHARHAAKRPTFAGRRNRAGAATAATQDFECPSGTVKYVSGEPTGDQCDGNCCDGDYACYYFTGCVAKDGSCSGTYACYYAQASLITGRSCDGNKACWGLGYAGHVAEVKNSCQGYKSCYTMAYLGGRVGTLENSCTDSRSCMYLAYGGGRVGNVKHGCQAPYACYTVSDAYYDRSSIGDIHGTCNHEDSCRGLSYGYIVNANVPQWGATEPLTTADATETPAECFAACKNNGACTGVRWANDTGACDLYQGPAEKLPGESNECGVNGDDMCLIVRSAATSAVTSAA